MIRAVYDMVRAFLRKLRQDTVSAFAAQTAFFVILSFLPFVMLLLALLRYLPISVGDLLRVTEEILPDAVNTFVAPLLREAFSKTNGAVLSATIIVALWSSSKGFLVIIHGLNAVYGNRETRNYFLVRALAVGYTVGFAVVLNLTLLLLVFGNQIYLQIQSRVPFLEHAAFIVISVRTAGFLLALTIYFLLLYLMIPNRKSRIPDELPGAFLAAVGWLGFSYLYSFYIDNLSDFSAIYGSLTAVVLCMIWLYACMYLMFIGAEFNVIVADAAVRRAWRVFRYSLKRKKWTE